MTGQAPVSGGEGAHIASVFFFFLSSDGLCKRAVSDAARAGLPGKPGAMDVWSFLSARPFPFLFFAWELQDVGRSHLSLLPERFDTSNSVHLPCGRPAVLATPHH